MSNEGKQKVNKETEEKIRKNAIRNMDAITKESIAAKKSGLSYGMYKAGLSAQNASGDGYTEYTCEIIRMSEKKVEEHPKAYIKAFKKKKEE